MTSLTADRSLLQSPDFLRLWTGSTASGLATWALPFVLGLAIVEGGMSAGEAGLALAARTLGFVLAMPVGGVLADRSGPRRMIRLASLTAALGLLPILASIAGSGGVVAAIVGAGIAGFGQGACRTAYQALFPRIVPDTQRQAGNALLTISVRVSTFAGPALATWAALQFGVASTLYAIAGMWAVSAFLPPWPVSSSSGKRPEALSPGRFVAELSEGLQEARRHPWFMAGLAALTVVIAFGYSVTSIVLPLVSEARYGGPKLLTASVTSYTLGALFGAFVIARWKPRSIGWWALGGLTLYGFVPFGLLVPGSMAVPIAAFFMAGLGIELFNVPWFTAIQREVPAERLARVSAIDFLFSYGLAPVSLALIAPLIGTFGTGPVLITSGLLCCCVPAMAMLTKGTRRFRSR